MIDADSRASIYLRNALSVAPLTVTPILYLSNGKSFTLSNVTLEPSGTAVVSINDELGKQDVAPWATLSGYVEVQYKWPWPALCATVTTGDAVHSIVFTSFLTDTSAAGSETPSAKRSGPNIIEGLWWKHEPGVEGFVAVSNTLERPEVVKLQVSDRHGNVLGEHGITISPHGTKLLNLEELRDVSAPDGGVRITYTGPENAVIVNGGLKDESTGYSATMHFGEVPDSSAPVVDHGYSELGLMTGEADPMLSFPPEAMFTPYSVVRNISDGPASVTPTLWWMEAGSARSARLRPLYLSPHQSANLNVPSLLASAGLKNFNGSLNLILDFHGKQHGLLMASGSVDKRGTYVFEVLPEGISKSISKSLGYWSTGNGDDTMVTLWNPADEAQDFVFTLYFSGGHYALPIHLDPRATRMFNVSEVIHNQIPDRDGNVIPPSVREGSADISGSRGEDEQILVALGAGVYNVRKATCVFYCIYCNGAQPPFAVSEEPFATKVSGQTQEHFIVTFHGGSKIDETNSSDWTSSDHTVATVAAGLVNGVAAGNVTIKASNPNVNQYFRVCGDPPDCSDCPAGVLGQADGTVGPYQVEPIATDSQGPAQCTQQGYAGWVRNVTNQVQQVDGSAYNVPNLVAADQIVVGGTNQLGITGTQTGQYATTGDGSFPDTYYVCSAACPGSGETDAIQNWTVAGIPLLHVNGVVYKCTSIAIDGKSN